MMFRLLSTALLLSGCGEWNCIVGRFAVLHFGLRQRGVFYRHPIFPLLYGDPRREGESGHEDSAFRELLYGLLVDLLQRITSYHHLTTQ
jgi:hypothetical protein